MNTLCPRFDQARILVIGDLMLDRYWSGEADRLSPEAPVPAVRINECKEQPGGAGNVAINCASLGVHTHLMGVAGDDEAATSLANILEAAGICCQIDRDSTRSTIIKLRVISHNQQLVRLDFEEPMVPDSAQLKGQLESLLDRIDILLLSDYGKGTLADTAALIAVAREHGIPVLVDPKGTDFDKYRGCTVITPNLKEFEAVVGPCPDEQTLLQKGHALRQRLDCKALLVTRGAQGMTLLQEDNAKETHFPAHAREVVDVTGAGDTVIATLASSLAAGSTLEEAADLANTAAGRVVTKLGSASVSQPEMQQLLARRRAVPCGVMTREQLSMAVATARARGERIVFTNGCFDILHAGHVGYLRAARARGDRLIVAVNDDASVHRLKGAGRPVNALERRMAVLAALEMVDWVVPFEEDTPEALLHLIRPDMLVKGGDYRLEDVIGVSFVRSYGGDAAVLAPLADCSTTRIVHRIRETEKAG